MREAALRQLLQVTMFDHPWNDFRDLLYTMGLTRPFLTVGDTATFIRGHKDKRKVYKALKKRMGAISEGSHE